MEGRNPARADDPPVRPGVTLIVGATTAGAYWPIVTVIELIYNRRKLLLAMSSWWLSRPGLQRILTGLSLWTRSMGVLLRRRLAIVARFLTPSCSFHRPLETREAEDEQRQHRE